MPEEMIFCPSCNQKVRVPAELLGTVVKCPLCGLVFTAPLPLPPQAPVALPPSSTGLPAEYSALPPRPTLPYPGTSFVAQGFPKPTSARLMAPAICLLVAGLLGLGLNAYRLLNLTARRQQMVREFEEMFRQIQEMFPTVQMQMKPETLVVLSLVSACFFAAANLIVVLGAVQMLRQRAHWLAVTASILAIFPLLIDCPCCVLSVPFGLWSLIVLMNPVVREGFRRTALAQ